MDFYVHLPSNSSHNFFPNNSASSFRTKLPSPLEFGSTKYEVAITELSYIYSFQQLPEQADRRVEVSVEANKIEKEANKTPVNVFYMFLKQKHYGDITQIVREINDGFPNLSRVKKIITYSAERRRVFFDFGQNIKKFKFSENLRQILGFSSTELTKTSVNYSLAENPVDLSLKQTRLFVYTDIIEPQIVGDTFAPLLTSTSFVGYERQPITHTFEPKYLPLNRYFIDTIHILLCNEFGEQIYFDFGTASVTLHFRPRKTRNDIIQ